ncbi:MAG: hypothetical protein H6R36_9, partial [Chloroflexi bacterium]|nr:hypothetical protein [Chloroflexota bacterium]
FTRRAVIVTPPSVVNRLALVKLSSR